MKLFRLKVYEGIEKLLYLIRKFCFCRKKIARKRTSKWTMFWLMIVESTSISVKVFRRWGGRPFSNKGRFSKKEKSLRNLPVLWVTMKIIRTILRNSLPNLRSRWTHIDIKTRRIRKRGAITDRPCLQGLVKALTELMIIHEETENRSEILATAKKNGIVIKSVRGS